MQINFLSRQVHFTPNFWVGTMHILRKMERYSGNGPDNVFSLDIICFLMQNTNATLRDVDLKKIKYERKYTSQFIL